MTPTDQPGREDDLASKEIFTTGEAAKICRVSQQTIIRCFDAGRIGGFRVPGSKFRRIPRAELIKFMRANGIPVENLGGWLGGARHVVLISTNAALAETLRRAVASPDQVHQASDVFAGGVLVGRHDAALVVLDESAPGLERSAVLSYASGMAGAGPRFIMLHRNGGPIGGVPEGVVGLEASAPPEEVARTAAAMLKAARGS